MPELRAKSVLGLLLAGALVLPATWVDAYPATSVHHRRVRHPVHHYVPPVPYPAPLAAVPPYAAYASAPPDQTTCRKMCDNDMLPCDPIYYKLADGRCNGLYPR